jgi:hypothetical protein
MIRHAITDNALVFIACFSRASLARGKSYQNEELTLAIEQMRLRRPADPWLIPVRFDECEIPDWDIGAGRTLNWLQRTDLFGDRAQDGNARLVATILRILEGHSDTHAPEDDRDPDVLAMTRNGLWRSLQGYWPFDADSAMDRSVNGNNLALSGGAGYTTGRATGALWVNGADGCASSARPVVRTDGDFTVMAWVTIFDASGFRTAVSQDGNKVSGFFLQYSGADSRWAFSITSADSADGNTTRALSDAAPDLNTWVHLAGVHNAGKGQLQLYVNGKLQGTKAFTGRWNAGKGFQVGRALWNGQATDFFPGAIDEVRIYSRVLSGTEIKSAADLTRNLIASYAMDEGFGETVNDHIGDHALTLSNPLWATGFSGSVSALRFAGAPSAATATGFIDTSASFSVSAWLRLSDTSDWHTAVSQDGTTVSGFFLQYSFDNDAWAFSMLSSDSTRAQPVRALAGQPRTGYWQHLVGVYDAQAHQLRIYVDGQRAGAAPFVTAWAAAGAFAIGRGLHDGPADWFAGDIDQVQVWNRALTDTDVCALV